MEMPNEHTGRERHQEISDISGELHKAALRLRHRKDTLKMLIQYVQQTMSKTPQQEQAGDQYKRDKIRLPSGSGKQSFLIILFHACYLLRVGKDTLFFR